MEQVRDATTETVQLAVLDGGDALYIGKADREHILKLDSSVGQRLKRTHRHEEWRRRPLEWLNPGSDSAGSARAGSGGIDPANSVSGSTSSTPSKDHPLPRRTRFVRAYPREAQERVFDAHERAFGLVGGGLASRTTVPLTSESDGLRITSSAVSSPVSTSTRSP